MTRMVRKITVSIDLVVHEGGEEGTTLNIINKMLDAGIIQGEIRKHVHLMMHPVIIVEASARQKDWHETVEVQ